MTTRVPLRLKEGLLIALVPLRKGRRRFPRGKRRGNEKPKVNINLPS